MKFLRDIICIAKYNGLVFVYTLDGNKYLIDDVTEDGLIYNGYEWQLRFMSNHDLNIIKVYKLGEELEEIIYLLKKKKRVWFVQDEHN